MEVDHDRFTRLDRAEDGRADLRISPHQSHLLRANRHLLISRLEKLQGMELAKQVEPAGVWELSPQLKPMLMKIGERIDALTLMRDALGEEAVHGPVCLVHITHR